MNQKPRNRNWPLCCEITKPTRFDPGGVKAYWADEWEALQKSRQGAPTNEQTPDQPAQVNDQPPDGSAEAKDAPGLIEGGPVQANAVPTNALVTAESANSAAIAVGPRTERGRMNPPDFARHARRCAVCSHPDRDAIEGDFIRWRSPELIAREYKIPDRTTIYRHVHSTGLFAWRRQELARVLEGVLESAEHIPLLSSDIITRAVRIYSHLDDSGNWFDPARINFVLTGPMPPICRPEVFEQSKSRRAKKQKARISNRNSRQIKKSVKSVKTKEKANS